MTCQICDCMAISSTTNTNRTRNKTRTEKPQRDRTFYGLRAMKEKTERRGKMASFVAHVVTCWYGFSPLQYVHIVSSLAPHAHMIFPNNTLPFLSKSTATAHAPWSIFRDAKYAMLQSVLFVGFYAFKQQNMFFKHLKDLFAFSKRVLKTFLINILYKDGAIYRFENHFTTTYFS